MKKCTYCGKQYPDEAFVCAIDGQPLQEVVQPIPVPMASPFGDKQNIVDAEHIKLLAIFHFVVAGLALVGLVFLLFHYLIMSTVFSNPDIWKSQKNVVPLPKEFMSIFIWFYIFFGFALGMASFLNLLSGLFLRQRRHRTFSIIVGGLNCLQIPLGTILGVFTIIVLSRSSVRAKYATTTIE